MAMRFYGSDSASDLSGGADFNLALGMSPTTGSAVTTSYSVAKSATETSYYFTPSSYPNNADWQTGPALFVIYNNFASPHLYLSIRIDRINSSGTLQESSTTTSEQSLGTTGYKVFEIDSKNWTAGNASDRLRIAIIVRNSSKTSSKTYKFVHAYSYLATCLNDIYQIRLEKKTGSGGSYGTLTTESFATGTYQDGSTFSDGTDYYYRGFVILNGVESASAGNEDIVSYSGATYVTMDATCGATSSASAGTIDRQPPLAGTVAAQSAVSGSIVADLALSATVNAVSTVTGYTIDRQPRLEGGVYARPFFNHSFEFADITYELSGWATDYFAPILGSAPQNYIASLFNHPTGYISQDVDLTNVIAIEFDWYGMGDGLGIEYSTYISVYIDTDLVYGPAMGNFIWPYLWHDDVDWLHVKATISGYSGVHTVKLVGTYYDPDNDFTGIFVDGVFATLSSASSVFAGTLDLQQALTGTVTAMTTVDALLSIFREILLDGTVSATSSASLTTFDLQQALTGTVDATSSASGPYLAIDMGLTGSVTVTSTASATTIDLQPTLTSTVTVTSTAAANMSLDIIIQGLIGGAASLTGELTFWHYLTSSVDALSSASGSLDTQQGLVGSIAATSQASASLTVEISLRDCCWSICNILRS